MSWHAKRNGGYTRSSQEAYDNCLMIYGILSSLGWSLNAVSGVLGNMESESGYNPWRWQYRNGNDDPLPENDPDIYVSSGKAYGLCQWDPASKYIVGGQGYTGYGPNYSDKPGSASDGRAQMYFLNDHADYYPTTSYPETYAEYKVTLQSADYCAHAWFYNFERGTWDEERVAAAEYWYETFGGVTPPSPGTGMDILFLKHFIDQNHKRRYIY